MQTGFAVSSEQIAAHVLHKVGSIVRLCDIAPENYHNLFRYFKLDRLLIPIIDILGATDYIPIWQ
jgi:hypothetical protein